MKGSQWYFLTVLSCVALLVALRLWPSGLLADPGSATPGKDPLEAFAQLRPIDAHIHVFNPDPAYAALLDRLHLGGLNICVTDNRDPEYANVELQRNLAFSIARGTGGRAAVCTTFSPYDFESPGFSQRVNTQLRQDFKQGALAVKVYKTIGMQIKTKAGQYLMPDDPAFDPIYKEIAALGRTVVAHFAEPDSCWAPPDPASPDYSYYKEHPGEYAFLHPEWPSKASILDARDRLLAKHPKLRVIGAHLGSMETDVDQIAQRLSRYPNFAVDTAARVPYFMRQPREKVRAFILKFQDRLLYGTDLLFLPNEDPAKAMREWAATYQRDWKYFATGETIAFGDKKVLGLQLPEPVLRKFFRENASRWIPGIEGDLPAKQ
jgi:predicted TIM-barrel fold metal-dependent hydrolase